MYKKIILTVIIFIIYLVSCYYIYTNNITKEKTITSLPVLTNKEEPIGKLIIKKINLENNLYKITSKHNNIEENPAILKESIEPTKENSIMFIAAHSGTGKLAFFNNLDKLQINDEITLVYKNITYNYIVTKIWEEPKNGYIHVNKSNSHQLVLTTCSPTKDDRQLIINSILKRVN